MVEICVCRRQQQRIARALSAVHLRAQRGEDQPQLAPRRRRRGHRRGHGRRYRHRHRRRRRRRDRRREDCVSC